MCCGKGKKHRKIHLQSPLGPVIPGFVLVQIPSQDTNLVQQLEVVITVT
jgi:hypothetical protein